MSMGGMITLIARALNLNTTLFKPVNPPDGHLYTLEALRAMQIIEYDPNANPLTSIYLIVGGDGERYFPLVPSPDPTTFNVDDNSTIDDLHIEKVACSPPPAVRIVRRRVSQRVVEEETTFAPAPPPQSQAGPSRYTQRVGSTSGSQPDDLS